MTLQEASEYLHGDSATGMIRKKWPVERKENKRWKNGLSRN